MEITPNSETPIDTRGYQGSTMGRGLPSIMDLKGTPRGSGSGAGLPLIWSPFLEALYPEWTVASQNCLPELKKRSADSRVTYGWDGCLADDETIPHPGVTGIAGGPGNGRVVDPAIAATSWSIMTVTCNKAHTKSSTSSKNSTDQISRYPSPYGSGLPVDTLSYTLSKSIKN